MGGAGGGGRAARALRLLLLLVMALAAVEYLCGSIFEASPLRTYLYTPLYNATQPTLKSRDISSSSWPTRLNGKPENDTQVKLPHIQSTKPDSLNISLTKKQKKMSHPKKITLPDREDVDAKKTISDIKVKATVTEGPVQETSTLISKLLNDTLKNLSSSYSSNSTDNLTKPYCEDSPNLGPVAVNKTEIALSSIENKFPQVEVGGWYRPPNCTAKHKVAIIIPFRHRQKHLTIFLNHMHPFLMKQQLDYGIFVIEQQGRNSFNRAKLFNVGFVESNRLREGGWQCFVFHDVDLLPLDERNIYSCPRQPRHMSASLDKHNFKLLYQDLFGGVSALTYEQFKKVNGFSNKYWGWGGEDDDMSYRVRKMGYHIARYKMSIARYTMLDHERQTPNPKRYKLLSQTNKNFLKDGLSSLEYELVEVAKHRLFTLVSVNINEDS